jgi:hypothetical protein
MEYHDDMIADLMGPEDPLLTENLAVIDAGEEPHERWKASGRETADWAMRKLGKLRLDTAEIAMVADKEIATIKAWKERASLVNERRQAYFEGVLTEWLCSLQQDDPKRLSISLPSGTIKSRKGSVVIDIDDEDEFVEWCRDNYPDLVEDVPHIDKAAAKKLLRGKVTDDPRRYPAVDPETGEVVPGAVIIRHARSYTVDTNEGNEATK